MWFLNLFFFFNQAKIDDYCLKTKGKEWDVNSYKFVFSQEEKGNEKSAEYLTKKKKDFFFKQIEVERNTFSSFRDFLTEIGYLVKEPEPFKIQTQNVDPEIADTPGPQLVVPIDNARFFFFFPFHLFLFQKFRRM